MADGDDGRPATASGPGTPCLPAVLPRWFFTTLVVLGKIDLELIEVQTGSHLDEENIERMGDGYHHS
jgi:Mannose-6-phosphate isomerase C-terminal